MHHSFFYLAFFFFTFNLKKNAFGVLWGHEGTSSQHRRKEIRNPNQQALIFFLPQASLPWYLVSNTKKRLTFLYLQRPLNLHFDYSYNVRKFVNYCQSARSVEGIANSSISEPCSRWSCSQCMKLKLIDRKIIHTKSTSKVC